MAIAAAWPGARLLETTGLGHHRLLREAAVLEEVAAFIATGAVACACGAPAAADDRPGVLASRHGLAGA